MGKQAFKVLTLSTLLTASILSQTQTAKADGHIQAVIKDEGQQKVASDSMIYKRTATASDTQKHITQSLQFNFIKDESYDKETVVLKTAGNIASGAHILDPYAVYTSTKRWPGEYKVSVTLPKTDSTAIIDYAPRNSDESREVTETIGLNIGGGLNLKGGGGDANLNGKYTFNESVKYKQDAYRTFLEQPTSPKDIAWGVEAYNINVNGYGPYNREKYNDIQSSYGNELFLKNRTSRANAGKNFVDSNQLPSLIASSFNPEFLTVFSHDYDDKDKSRIKVKYERNMDDYLIKWKTFYWSGYNKKNTAKEAMTATYEIDWETHSVKFIKAE
ncbi:beta-channel forming cytolysin [Staphylococcus sp. IVB6181]|uniref:beta-channel forming cytolysin n=1 Tax=Staphylococcus sp. IVB6181 TaxID=2929481 RepID=UPI0021D0E187|nr:beta-channel forming cytolysin [Staphylococcus sp. IVB6181]UXV34927.1 beta-channel forming cytolysin [Staphylococcus sp. IVB6181]